MTLTTVSRGEGRAILQGGLQGGGARLDTRDPKSVSVLILTRFTDGPTLRHILDRDETSARAPPVDSISSYFRIVYAATVRRLDR